MAWWLQQEFDDERGKRISYSSEWMGDSEVRFKDAMAQVAAKMTAKYFTPDPGPRPWPACVHDVLLGSGPTIGFKQPMPDRPYQIRFTEKIGYLPDCHGFMITNRVRDAIEALEPNVHQYLPCEFYDKDGTRMPEERWYLNICTRLDTIAAEHCNIVISPHTAKYLTGNGETDVKLWKEKVAGHAIWSEWKYNNDIYVSDAFVEAMNRMEIYGWIFRQYLPEI